jgi:alkanesulfonate monooxygenase SsuD/methylene tetrahydromethanopterin reductase-like flavin-dependent oxidoreductase (luciferase family)
MLKIGVELSGQFEDAGEYLADARALDAAGVDSLWLDGRGDEPWMLLAGIAAVTGRVRLVAPISGADLAAPAELGMRTATLDRLSRGRVALKLTRAASATALLDLVQGAGRRQVIVDVESEDQVAVAARRADGLVVLDASPDACRSTFESLIRLRGESGLTGPFELWARCRLPEDRGAWKQTLLDYEAARACGVLVPAGPRLLDMLRNADEEDDRSDLALAQG